jgi:DNA-binding transcriptional regulator YiaG
MLSEVIMKVVPIDEIFARHMTAASVRRAKTKAAGLLEELELRDIRAALKLTQRELARTMKVAQPTLAKIEKQPDMQIATLRKVVRAMGGDIDLIARFPGAAVRVKLPA